jgi:peptidyl-prolyl isomerase E (cyclophilin E)
MAKRMNMLYVGGIDDTVSEDVLHAAFIPFGELKSIQIPKDYKQSKYKKVHEDKFYVLSFVNY